MSATYTDWSNVPAHVERKIRKIWNGSGTACWDKGWDRNNDSITVYRLADYCVARNVEYLTDEQKLRMFDLVASSGVILSNLLESLSFEIEAVRVHDEIYHLPGIIVGTWPHCKMFGGMDETGYVHT